MKQLTLPIESDPAATLASYLGGGTLAREEAARDFLCWGHVFIPSDVPQSAIIEAASAIWTADELGQLRSLQSAFAALQRPQDESLWPDYEREWLAAWKAETLCRARLIRRVSTHWADYWERGWRASV